MRKFYDIDHDRVWTEDELRNEHKRLIAEDFTEDEKEILLPIIKSLGEIYDK